MLDVGSRLPEVAFSHIDNGEMKHPESKDLFAGKKVALFALPGAFTPTCSAAHLPGFVALADKLKEKGVDSIVCLSVNDAFVMDAWGKANNAEHLLMIADGNATFTKSVGMDMDTGDFGGVRSMRYSMLVDDGVVTQINIEEPGRFEVSDAETLLKSL